MSALAFATPPRLTPGEGPSIETSPEFVHHGVPVMALPPGLQQLLARLKDAPWVWAALEADAKRFEAEDATGEQVLRIPWQYGRVKEPLVTLLSKHSRPPKKGRGR